MCPLREFRPCGGRILDCEIDDLLMINISRNLSDLKLDELKRIYPELNELQANKSAENYQKIENRNPNSTKEV